MHRRPLTPRQLEVAERIAVGRSHADIARELGISIYTVGKHAAAINRALGGKGKARTRLLNLTESPSAA